MRRILELVRVGIRVLVFLVALSETGRAGTPAGVKALESRLYAPCCYGGTLDIHESDLARSLREEITSRLARGESSDAIQNDFVVRYGDKVLAARSDLPIRTMGLGLGLAAIVAAAGLIMVVLHWTRGAQTDDGARGNSEKDELDERIDAELSDLDS
jgi:cytochrome c-type biogenesis protein CcmH